MEIIESGMVAEGRPGTPHASNCFPSVAALGDGTLIVGYRAGSTKMCADGIAFVTKSTDGGRTWSAPIAPLDSTLEDTPGSIRTINLSQVSPGRLVAVCAWFDRSDPDLPLFNPETEGLLPCRNLLCESRDAGKTWTVLRVADTTPFHQASSTGPIRRVSANVLASFYETNKDFADAGPWDQKAVVKFSHDEGLTWPDHAIVATDPTRGRFYWDQRNVVLRENVLLGCFWTFDRCAEKDVPIHTSQSDDGGRTWSPPRNTDIVGQVAYPAGLGDGRVFLAYVDRYGTRSVRARLSHDEAESWDGASELVLWPTGDARVGEEEHGNDVGEYLQSMQAWSFGLPCCVTLPDGDVFVTYYAGDAQVQSIYWARVKV